MEDQEWARVEITLVGSILAAFWERAQSWVVFISYYQKVVEQSVSFGYSIGDSNFS